MESTYCCRQCGTPFSRTADGPGRPSVFCGVACRRAAEYRCRRLQDHLIRLERELEAARRNRWDALDTHGANPEESKTDITSEIAAAEGELRALLGGLAGEIANAEGNAS